MSSPSESPVPARSETETETGEDGPVPVLTPVDEDEEDRQKAGLDDLDSDNGRFHLVWDESEREDEDEESEREEEDEKNEVRCPSPPPATVPVPAEVASDDDDDEEEEEEGGEGGGGSGGGGDDDEEEDTAFSHESSITRRFDRVNTLNRKLRRVIADEPFPISEDDEETGLLTEKEISEIKARMEEFDAEICDLPLEEQHFIMKKYDYNARVLAINSEVLSTSGSPFKYRPDETSENLYALGFFACDKYLTPGEMDHECLERYEEVPENVRAVIRGASGSATSPDGEYLDEFSHMTAREQLAVFQNARKECAENIMKGLCGRHAIKLKTVRAAVAAMLRLVRRCDPHVVDPIGDRHSVRMAEWRWIRFTRMLNGIISLLSQASLCPTAFRSANGCRTACVFNDVLSVFERNVGEDE